MENYEHVEPLWSHAVSVQTGEDDLRSYSGKLFHYTTSSGLLGILGSQQLWATEAAYLNDSNEIEYGLSMVVDTLQSISSNEGEGATKNIILKTLTELQKRHDEIYVACLSEDGDLLSQWKGYGDFGNGFAIEFNSAELTKFKRKGPYFDITISRVEYEKDEQVQIVRSEVAFVLSKHEQLLKAYPQSSRRITDSAVGVLATVLRHKALWFKSAAFREEREWRAVRLNPGTLGSLARVPAKFRVTNGSMVPYIEFDLGPSAQKTSWQLPISAIVIGSKVNQERAEKSINLLYKNLSLDPPPVRRSSIPLR